jgi:hypothetical protein
MEGRGFYHGGRGRKKGERTIRLFSFLYLVIHKTCQIAKKIHKCLIFIQKNCNTCMLAYHFNQTAAGKTG